MKAQQIKISLESNRNVMNDPRLKNKAERDRRIRELKDYNTKRFIDQRKAQAQRNERQMQDLLRRHEEEEQGVIAGVNRVSACSFMLGFSLQPCQSPFLVMIFLSIEVVAYLIGPPCSSFGAIMCSSG